MECLHSGDEGFDPAWQRLLTENGPVLPWFAPAVRPFHVQSARDLGYTWEDRSVIVVSDSGRPLAAFFGGIREKDGERHLGFGDVPCGVVAAEQSMESEFASEEELVHYVKTILRQSRTSRASLVDFSCTRLSGLFTWFVSRGAIAVPGITRVLALKMPEETLWSDVRKSYRNLVNRALKDLDVTIMDQDNVCTEWMDEFQSLHTTEAGMQTRSDSSWALRTDQIRAGEAFAVLGRLDDDLVSAGLFNCAGATCRYGVSASKRELFDKPMFHGLMWTAIRYAKTDGRRFFEVGDPGYAIEGIEATSKEKGIGMFKSGFGGHDYVRMQLEWSE